MASEPARPGSRLVRQVAKATALVLIGAAGLRATLTSDDAGSAKLALASQAGIVVAAVGLLALIGPRLFADDATIGIASTPLRQDSSSAPTDLIGRRSPATTEAEQAIQSHEMATTAPSQSEKTRSSSPTSAVSLPSDEILRAGPAAPITTADDERSSSAPTTTSTRQLASTSTTLLRPATATEASVVAPLVRPAPATTQVPTTFATTTALAASTTTTTAVRPTSTKVSPPTTTRSTTTTSATTAPPTTARPTTTTAAVTTTAPPTTVPTTTTAPPTTTTAPPTTVTPTTVPPTTTAAPTTTTTTAQPAPTTAALSYWEAAGQESLAQITYQWQAKLPGWSIDFKPEKSGYRGLTLVREKRIEVYVRPSPGAVSTAHVLAHEIGHAVDVTRLNSAERAQWLAGRGLSASQRWFPNSGAEDFASGAGDFAEAFANWQIGTPTNSRLAGQPTAAQLALVAQLSN